MSAPAHIARANGMKGGRPKGAKGWKTIEKEQFASHYEEEMKKKWAQIVDVHTQEATNPENTAERKLAIEQIRGKAKEQVEHTGEIRLSLDV